MVGLVLELQLTGLPPGSAEQQNTTRAGDDLLATLTDWWSTQALEPFEREPVNRKLDPIDVTMTLLGEPVAFTVRFDENNLADLIEAYAVHGWPAVEEVERRVTAHGEIVKPTRELVRASRTVLAVLVADALRRVEAVALTTAQGQWTQSRRQLQTWLQKFTVYPWLRKLAIFKDRAVGSALVDQCHEYAHLRRRVLALQKDIDNRNRKVPPSRRQKGSGADLWFELYAAPQRELLEQMSKQLALITTTFPAAALVLDDLPDELLDLHDPRAKIEATGALAAAIHTRLDDLAKALDGLLATLGKPPVTDILTKVVDRVRAGDLTGLRDLEMPDGGFEQQVLEAVFERDEDDDQRVLANLGLLDALRESDTVEPGSMDGIVLFRYVLRLADEMDRRRVSEERWATFWTVLEWIGAALGLIALLALFPFGEAAAPALIAALSLAGAASAVIGVVLLVLHQIIGVMQEAGDMDRAARDQLFRLAQDEPEAVREIGQALARSSELRDAMVTGALVTVLTLGAARKIKVVAAALTLQGFLDDIETVFRPLAQPAGPTP